MRLVIIKGQDEMDFVTKVNKAIADYEGDYDVAVSYPAEKVAYITLSETEVSKRLAEAEKRWERVDKENDPVTKEFHDQGIRHTCGQCPYLEVGNDKRRKWWPCKYSEYGTSTCNTECCEYFYKMLKQGEVEIKEAE